MKPKTASVALAAGLFLLALWLAFRPHAAPPKMGPVSVQRPADINGSPAAFAPTPGPVVKASPSVAPESTKVAADQQTRPNAGAAASAVLADTDTAERRADGKANSTPRDAQIDVVKVRVMMHDYHNLMNENPVGTNAEIMKALMGNNSKTATLGPPEGMTLNGAGELVDQWNTPYFFHQLSKDVMEIRSAGPDRVMWTADDIVTR